RRSTARTPWQSRASGSPLHRVLGLAFLHHLSELVDELSLDGHETATRVGPVLLGGDARADVDGVADLDRPLELPLEPTQGAVGRRRLAPRGEAVLDADAEEPLGIPPAEDGTLHVLGYR